MISSERNKGVETAHARERVILFMVDNNPKKESAILRQANFNYALDEARELLAATDGVLVDTITCRRDKPSAALFIGKGKAEELKDIVAAQDIDLVIFNHELSPTQERNLERVIGCRVLDRVGLILSIFAARAQTQEGKLQVELAQLTHWATRLVRGYAHLQSQRGGIGLKGPGETQLETDRRLIGIKVTQLKKRIAALKKQRAVQRQNRLRGGEMVFATVGYTNAGKSTLFNRLTKSDVFVKDQLFATLDTTARKLWLNQATQIILTDTVGFVRDLPHGLIAAFSATLEETAFADVLLHVVDISHPEYERQMENVNQVLKEIKADGIPQLWVFNKIDKCPDLTPKTERDHTGRIVAVYLSAKTSEGVDELRAALIELAESAQEQ